MPGIVAPALWLLLLAPLARAAVAPAEPAPASLRPQCSNNVARPLRYFPIHGDFVITNGTEYFNRPLYGAHSAFRIDGGDKPEFSLYLPGRGGNLRLGIQTPAGSKWLNDADQIVTRYRAGSLIYEIHDALLGGGELDLTVLPLSGTKGLIGRAELNNVPPAIRRGQFIFAFGGANGMRGRRGGDIGCESEPVSEFFQLRPEECRGNEFSLADNTFLLRSRAGTLAGIFPPGSKLRIADATDWDSPAALFSNAPVPTPFPIVAGRAEWPDHQPIYFLLREISGAERSAALSAADLPGLFSAAENYRRQIAGQVLVQTPDPFLNAAVPALNVAADAIWDARQRCFMHGAVAWRQRLLGWRGLYAGDALGWHSRTAEHFAGFAREQNTNPVPSQMPPADEKFNLARNETALHSNGDLTQSHYDMNLVAVDAFFRHLLWTGDLAFARTNWPVIERHFAWERRLFRRQFGPEHLPLYEAYAAIWASDNLSYNGGGTAHASAYNYFANLMAARVARLIGQDPTPYAHEADLIRRAMNQYLWVGGQRGRATDGDIGHFAEYKDYLGRQGVHPGAALWTFYITMDSEVPTPAEAWQMARWVDQNLAHIPIRGENVPDKNLFVLPESNWMPYEWSLNNVVVAENVHAALGFWQANRPETAFALFKGALLDTMFLGLCPGNVGCLTSHDAARGEAQRDFADGIGITARALVEGLFGVHPDALAGQLKITPGFPTDWNFATMHHPDFDFAFRRGDSRETFSVTPKFPTPMKLLLQIPARPDQIQRVTVNGRPAKWRRLDGVPGVPRIEIRSDPAEAWTIVVTPKRGVLPAELGWQRPAPRDATSKDPAPFSAELPAPHAETPAGESFNWKEPLPKNARLETVALAPFFNDRVTQIFKNRYRSPRSPFCSLATPVQGIGGWVDFNEQFAVDDSGLRALAARNGGKIVLPDGVPFATPTNAGAPNVVFTSQWDNYPRAVSVPLTGRASRVFLLMAGSTGPMQSRFDNGEIVVTYADGARARLPLRNPETWWPIDQDYFTDDFAFRLDAPLPPRVDLATGKIRLLDAATFKGRGGKIPGGAATVLELPLDPTKDLQSLTVRALANEVVIGLMAATLERD